MHGRPRDAKGAAADPTKARLAVEKAAALSRLVAEVLARRAAGRHDAESLALAGSLLELNPEVYSAWNYRREALQPTLEAKNEVANAAAAAELALTERALRRNPKSYAAWHQRRWVVGFGLTPLGDELALVTKLLALDERNFHGWNYRRFVAGVAGIDPADELAFTSAKINTNFSNYSAWHSRTALLPTVHGEAPTLSLGELMEAEQTGTPLPSKLLPWWLLEEEFALVQQALWTEPDDQSGWLYHRWLLGAALQRCVVAKGTSHEGEARVSLAGVIEREEAMCRELLEVEPDTKWPLLTLARLLRAKEQWVMAVESSVGKASGIAGGTGTPSVGAGGDGRIEAGALPAHRHAAGQAMVHEMAGGQSEADSLFQRLIELDPLRRGYYEDELRGISAVITRPAHPI